MPFNIDPNLIENNDVQLTEDGNGDLALKHVPSGTTLTVDEDVNISDFWDDNNSEITADVNNQSLSTEDLKRKAKEASTHTGKGDKRQIITTERTELYVDPVNGDDSGDGTESDPIKTYGEMWSRVPYFIEHRFHIYLREGTLDAAPGVRQIGPVRIFTGSDYLTGQQPFSIQKHPNASASNVIIDGNINRLPSGGPELDKPTLKDVTVTGSVAPGTGHVTLENVTFTGASSDIQAGRAVNSHDMATIRLRNCTFKSALENVASMAQGSTLFMQGNTGTVSETAYQIKAGSRVVFDSYNPPIGERLVNLASGGSMVGPTGEVYTQNTRLLDTFLDNRLTDRFGDPRGGVFAWDITNGSPSVSGEALKLPAGNNTIQNVITSHDVFMGKIGTAEIDFSFDSSPTGGDLIFRVFRESSNKYWSVQLSNGGSVNIVKNDSGGPTVTDTGSYTVNTNGRTIVIKRSTDIDNNGNAGVDVSIDGSSKVTTTDTFAPQINRMRILSTLDAGSTVNRLEMREP